MSPPKLSLNPHDAFDTYIHILLVFTVKHVELTLYESSHGAFSPDLSCHWSGAVHCLDLSTTGSKCGSAAFTGSEYL